MNSSIAPVLAAAESLSVAERRELIDLLLAGLDEVAPADEAPSALTEVWRQEVARRSSEYDAGRAETVPWEEVKARWQARREVGG